MTDMKEVATALHVVDELKEGPGTEGSIAASVPAYDYSKVHPLHNQWTLWYNNPAKKGKDQKPDWSVKKIIDFETVEDFWRLYNNIAKPSDLGTGSNYHLFKTGTAPEWEDLNNKQGGKWVINLPRKRAPPGEVEVVDEAWQWTLLALIGEFFEDSDEINGVVISPRKGTNRLSLWTKNASKEETCKTIGRLFRDTLLRHLLDQNCDIGPELDITYAVHADCLKHSTSFRTTNHYKI
jgi:translation initiation factor 4E